MTTTDTTIVRTPEALETALRQCRGEYQRGLVLGRYRLSGGDLRGKAGKYGAVYARSRKALLGRLRAAGLTVSEETGPRGLRILVIA